MKPAKITLTLLAIVMLLFAITPIRKAMITFVRVDIMAVGTEDSYVWLPGASRNLVRLDSWKAKEMFGTPVLALTIYNGSEWNVGGVEVTVSNGSEKRSFRCAVRTAVEYSGAFVSGAPTYISTREAGFAVCESGAFAKKDSLVTINGVYGWKP